MSQEELKMRLSDLKPGDKATVIAVEATGEVAQRLLDHQIGVKPIFLYN